MAREPGDCHRPSTRIRNPWESRSIRARVPTVAGESRPLRRQVASRDHLPLLAGEAEPRQQQVRPVLVKSGPGDVRLGDERGQPTGVPGVREHLESFRIFILSVTAEKRTLEPVA